MEKREIDEKVVKYEHFLNETLKGDLDKLHSMREKLYEEIAQYLQLETTLQKLEENKLNENGKPLKTQVDLGCNFFAQAVVDDPSMVFVSVGFGFFVEFTYREAIDFSASKMKQLNTQVEKISKDMAHVRAQMHLVLEGLRELQGIS